MSFTSILDSGRFIITVEVSPPKGTDASRMLRDAELVREFADAVNVTDNQRAVMRMSSMAACSILQEKGLTTVMHMTCRDRNRIALQSDLLGAHSLGIRNILVMSGDHTSMGDNTGAKPVYDLDPVQLLGIIQELNHGLDFSGNELIGKTDFCTGAVTNIELNDIKLIKLKKKMSMGVRFLQTQAVFDIKSFDNFIEKIKSLDQIRSGKIKVIAGIMPLRSERNIVFLNKVPGIRVPEYIIEKIKRSESPEIEGMRIAAGLISELRTICDGVHIMPVGNHENTRKILEMAGIL